MEKLKQWIHQLNTKQQLYFKFGLISFLLLVTYLSVLYPMEKTTQRLQDTLATQETLIHWMKTNIGPLKSQKKPPQLSGSFLSFVESKLPQDYRSAITLNPINQDAIQLRVKKMTFDGLMKWLSGLNASGIWIKKARFMPLDETGTVEAHITLHRN